jgi:hypothetical protein
MAWVNYLESSQNIREIEKIDTNTIIFKLNMVLNPCQMAWVNYLESIVKILEKLKKLTQTP